jgi:glycosyltransferase involved in cell wall biosynthesis
MPKKIKLGIYLENSGVRKISFRTPEAGNPGSGGTEFLMATLPHYMHKYASDKVNSILFANSTTNLPSDVPSVESRDLVDAAQKAKAENCDFFIYRPRRNLQRDFLSLIDEINLKTISWAHVTPKYEYIRAMSKTKNIKAFVCVEHEQHDQLRDSPLYKRLTYIVNGFDVEGFASGVSENKSNFQVCYLGALVPQKGFHVLAKAWAEVLKRHPSANLIVIGSGNLYFQDAKLGPWGIASKEYEETNIIPYLSNEYGLPIESVNFLGKLGVEKKSHIKESAVGIVNPTGRTENCPGSALEFQALAVPVIGGAYNGLLDTVKNGRTGILAKNESELIDGICKLLDDKETAIRFGNQGVEHVKSRYNYKKVVAEWISLFSALENNQQPKQYQYKKNCFQHLKFLGLINIFFQRFLGMLVDWPGMLEIKERISRRFNKSGF